VNFKSIAMVILVLTSHHSHAQNLFGNPSCSGWSTWGKAEKTTWLNAFLVPLNLTNVARKKPKEDQFSKLTSLDSAVVYVNTYCNSNPEDQASVGAIQFLDQLTSQR
jgi:hypothetical protein